MLALLRATLRRVVGVGGVGGVIGGDLWSLIPAFWASHNLLLRIYMPSQFISLPSYRIEGQSLSKTYDGNDNYDEMIKTMISITMTMMMTQG